MKKIRAATGGLMKMSIGGQAALMKSMIEEETIKLMQKVIWLKMNL